MDPDVSALSILIALFIIILTTVFLLIKRYYKAGRRFVLLTGLNGSGKTLIYSQLLHNKHLTTYTSCQENVDQYETGGKEVAVVDLPGYHSIRQRFFEKYKENSRGIVYVVDSVEVVKNIRDVAMVLYNILVDPVVIKNGPEMLILFNKQDQTTAKGSNVIKSLLEKEMNILRNTQLNQVKQLDAKENVTNKLGDTSKDFSFSNLYCKVEFAESFAFNKNGSIDIEALKTWIRRVAN